MVSRRTCVVNVIQFQSWYYKSIRKTNLISLELTQSIHIPLDCPDYLEDLLLQYNLVTFYNIIWSLFKFNEAVYTHGMWLLCQYYKYSADSGGTEPLQCFWVNCDVNILRSLVLRLFPPEGPGNLIMCFLMVIFSVSCPPILGAISPRVDTTT